MNEFTATITATDGEITITVVAPLTHDVRGLVHATDRVLAALAAHGADGVVVIPQIDASHASSLRRRFIDGLCHVLTAGRNLSELRPLGGAAARKGSGH